MLADEYVRAYSYIQVLHHQVQCKVLDPWFKTRCHWSLEQWKHVLWSDAAHFSTWECRFAPLNRPYNFHSKTLKRNADDRERLECSADGDFNRCYLTLWATFTKWSHIFAQTRPVKMVFDASCGLGQRTQNLRVGIDLLSLCSGNGYIALLDLIGLQQIKKHRKVTPIRKTAPNTHIKQMHLILNLNEPN